MEELLEAGFAVGSLDVTTTEFCDHVAGGVLAAVPERLESAGRRGHPAGRLARRARHGQLRPAATPCPERYRDRNLYVHNPTITLMRTTPEECREIGGIDRAEAQRGDRADGALRAAARRLGDRDRGAAVPRPRGRRGAVRDAPRDGRRDEGRGARGRRRRQRPGVRARDGEPAARADRGARDDQRARRSRACAPRSTPAARSSAPAPAPGLSAKCAEAGGADLIIIYNSGRYRMAGRGSLSGLLPYGDANAIVVDMAREVLPDRRATRRCSRASAAPTRSG